MKADAKPIAELLVDEEFLSGKKEIVLIFSDGPQRIRVDPRYYRYFNRCYAPGKWENHVFCTTDELRATAVLMKPLPPVFASEAEEAEFWATHDSEDFDLGEAIDVVFTGALKRRECRFGCAPNGAGCSYCRP
jgi:hypothetical protein